MMQAGSAGRSKTRGENHPNGAILNYYLEAPDTTAHEYRMIFLGPAGDTVRAFSSSSEKPQNRFTVTPGAGRFIWDLRTDGVEPVPGMILWFVQTRGPEVLPGTYTAVLCEDNNCTSVPLPIQMDPRVSASAEDLQVRHQFLLEVRDQMNRMNQLVIDIRSTRSQLESLQPKLKDSTLLHQLNQLVQTLNGIETTIYQTQNRSAQDPLNYPIRLNNKYGHLGALAGMGFFKPTASMVAVKAELEAEIQGQWEAWSTAQLQLRDLNTALLNAKIPYLTVD
jgi:hypothetical protein